jgi:hypothetical protein
MHLAAHHRRQKALLLLFGAIKNDRLTPKTRDGWSWPPPPPEPATSFITSAASVT